MSETVEKTQQQEDGNKIAKNFKATMDKLVAIVGGDKNLFPIKKVGKDVLKTIVDGLLTEKKETLEKEVKADVIKLLEGHVALQKAISEKKKELAKLEQDKMKEFNDSASKLFGKIESIDALEKEYYSSLSASISSSSEIDVKKEKQ